MKILPLNCLCASTLIQPFIDHLPQKSLLVLVAGKFQPSCSIENQFVDSCKSSKILLCLLGAYASTLSKVWLNNRSLYRFKNSITSDTLLNNRTAILFYNRKHMLTRSSFHCLLIVFQELHDEPLERKVDGVHQ